MKKTKFEEELEEAVQNVTQDRATVKSVLMDAMIYLKKNDENHKTTGMVVAKYFEALQRSNDQLMTLREKREKHEGEEFTADDIYDMIDHPEEDN